MRAAGLDLNLLTRAPYSIMSCDEFEEAAQVIDVVGLETFFESKLSGLEDGRSWPYGNFLRHQFAKERKVRKLVFRDEAEAMFNRLAAHVAAAAA